MNKKIGQMLLLLVVLLLVLAGLMWKNHGSDSDEEESASDTESASSVEVIPLKEDDVAGVTFLMNGDDVSFSKSEDGWTYDGDPEFPVDPSEVDSIVGEVAGLTSDHLLENAAELSEYGLDEPTNVVTLTGKDGQEEKLTIGIQNSSSFEWYVYRGEESDKIYMVNGSFGTMFPANLMDCAASESLPAITSDHVTEISVEGESGYTLTKDLSSGKWTVTSADGFSHRTDDDAVSTLTTAASSLSYDSLVEYDCEDLAAYGLAEPAMRIRVKYTEEEEDSTESVDSDSDAQDASEAESDSESKAQTVTVDRELILLVGSQDEDGNYYAAAEGSAEVHRIENGQIRGLAGSDVSEYWALSLGELSTAELSGMDVTKDGETKKLERRVQTEETTDEDGETNEKQTVTYLCDGAEVDATAFSSFFSALTSAEAQTKDLSLTANAEPEFTVAVHMKDGDVTFAFSPYDSSFYYVEDMEGVPSLVNKNVVKKLIEQYEELV